MVKKTAVATVRLERRRGTHRAQRGTTLLAVVDRAGAPLGQACRGQGVCRSCRVLILAGEAHVEDMTDLEARWPLEPGWRLACQTRVRAPDREAAEIVIWSPAWGVPRP